MTSLVKQSESEVVVVAGISAAFAATMAVTYLVWRSARMMLARIGPRRIHAATHTCVSR
jgi:hypothetical protein